MERKEVTVSCPCCESRLDVDVLTSKVLSWRKKGEVDETGKPKLGDEDWASASERASRRSAAATDQFDESLSREKSRARDLDELFRKAAEKAREREDE